MRFLDNLSLNIYSILILLILYIIGLKQMEKDSYKDKLFRGLVKITILALFMDIFGRFDGKAEIFYPILNTIGNFFLFILNPIIPSLYFLYTHIQIYENEKVTKKIQYYLFMINCSYLCILLISLYFGSIYYIDSDNIYHRGNLFWIPVAFSTILMLHSLVLVIIKRNLLGRRRLLSLFLLPLFPFICIFIQTLFYGTSLVLNSIALSLLIIFINIQNHSMNLDYLTGIYNRKKLDIYMREKINSSNEKQTFSAILLDIDNFKSINDTYGHTIGDRALESAVKVLCSCIKQTDFIARFGGDEFCIILNDVTNIEELELVIHRIKKGIDRYNSHNNALYKIGFSMGYAVYDYQSGMNLDMFQKHIDSLMYENKMLHKNIEYRN